MRQEEIIERMLRLLGIMLNSSDKKAAGRNVAEFSGRMASRKRSDLNRELANILESCKGFSEWGNNVLCPFEESDIREFMTILNDVKIITKRGF